MAGGMTARRSLGLPVLNCESQSRGIGQRNFVVFEHFGDSFFLIEDGLPLSALSV